MTIQEIADNGVIGAGGAGFPAHIKLGSRPEYLIVNTAECEPLLHKDKELLKNRPKEFINGFRIAMELCGAQKGILAIKEKHEKIARQIATELPAGTRIVCLGDFYPAGDEIILIYSITGRVVQPGQLPITAGCLVQNVETLCNIGSGKPVIEKYLTIAGAVENPVTLQVPVGTSFKDLVSCVSVKDKNCSLVVGGIMMGYLEENLDNVVTKRTAGLIFLPSEHYVIKTLKRSKNDHIVQTIAKAACDQCSYCTELCPRYLLGHPVRPEMAMRNRICSGKFLIIMRGEIGDIEASLETAKEIAGYSIVQVLSIPNVEEKIFPAISGVSLSEGEQPDAMLIVETFSVASCIKAADYAVKTADVTILRIHVAMAIGGRGFFVLTGNIDALKSAQEASLEFLKDEGTLVGYSLITQPDKEVLRGLI